MENFINYTATDQTTPLPSPEYVGGLLNDPITFQHTALEANLLKDTLNNAFQQIPLEEHIINGFQRTGYLLNDTKFNNLLGVINLSPYVFNFISCRVPQVEALDVKADSLEGFCKFVYKRRIDLGKYFVAYKGARLETVFFSIVTRKIANYYRSNRIKFDENELNIMENNTNRDPLEIVAIKEVLDNLPDDQQQALLLRYHYGLDVSQIARIVSKTYSGAENLLSRARAAFKKGYKEE